MSDSAPVWPNVAAAEPGARGALRRSVLIALTAFLTVVDLFATQAILPPLARAYGVSAAAMGLAVNASTLGMAAASLAVAFFSQRLDRRRGILFSLAALSVPTLLLSVAPGLVSFALLRIAQGVLMASAFTLMLAYLGEQCSEKDAASAFAAYITGNVASNLFGRLISAAIADHFGTSANFILFAGLNLAGAALVYFTIDHVPTMTQETPPARPWTALSRHLGDRSMRAAFGIGFCILFAFIGIFTFVNFVLVRPPVSVGMMTVGFVYFVFLPSIFTTPYAGRLVAWLGTRRALWATLAVAASGLPVLLAPTLWAIVVGLGVVAVGTFLAQAIATRFVSRAATSDRGAASGLYLASYFSGGLVGTAILGWVFDSFGWPACVAGVALALAAAALLGRRLTLPREA